MERIWQALSRGALVIVTLCALQACTQSAAKWTDEVLLHDGRTIEVARDAHFHYVGDNGLLWTQVPDQYGFTAKNPDTGKSLRWLGSRGFSAAVLDFWERTPYLVILSMYSYADLRQYGCPEIPYVFLRYDEAAGKWRQIAANDFPPALLRANLRLDYREDTRIRFSHKEIEIDNRGSGSSGHFTVLIPTDFASWPSRYKNGYRVEHYSDGCRHTVPSNLDPAHPQSPGHDAPLAGLEILESHTFESAKVFSQIEWRERISDRNRWVQCRSLVRRVEDNSDMPQLRGWLVFVNDPTGTRKARDTGAMFCDADALWFAEYGDRKHVFLTKFTIAGDFVYRLKFRRPASFAYYVGSILQPSFRAEAGYLYFEWWESQYSGASNGDTWLVKRTMQVRLREPSAVP
jgi:hypothetical protein